MLFIGINEELLRDASAETAFWKHAPNGSFDHLDWEFAEHNARGTGTKTAVVLRDVVVVLLVLGSPQSTCGV